MTPGDTVGSGVRREWRPSPPCSDPRRRRSRCPAAQYPRGLQGILPWKPHGMAFLAVSGLECPWIGRCRPTARPTPRRGVGRLLRQASRLTDINPSSRAGRHSTLHRRHSRGRQPACSPRLRSRRARPRTSRAWFSWCCSFVEWIVVTRPSTKLRRAPDVVGKHRIARRAGIDRPGIAGDIRCPSAAVDEPRGRRCTRTAPAPVDGLRAAGLGLGRAATGRRKHRAEHHAQKDDSADGYPECAQRDSSWRRSRMLAARVGRVQYLPAPVGPSTARVRGPGAQGLGRSSAGPGGSQGRNAGDSSRSPIENQRSLPRAPNRSP